MSNSLKGLTLVETIAGTALIGTVLISIIVASARFSTQTANADQRIQACKLADSLLDTWWQDNKSIPVNQSGIIDSEGNWRWKTSIVTDSRLDKLICNKVALEIKRSDSQSVACRIELLVNKDETE